MKPSQMPEAPRVASRWVRGSQPLKSPITETARASGAHTAKVAPAVPPNVVRWQPSLR